MKFEFENAEIIDRDPPSVEPGRTVFAVDAGFYAVAGMSAKLSLTRSTYPEPPPRFVASPDVDTLWHRYQEYKDEREPLAGMAYFCLSWIRNQAGGQDQAATEYAVAREVLRELGRLTSTVGDKRTARKAPSELRPYTPQEEAWIEAAVRALIRRVGEWAAGSDTPLRQITMADLPTL